MRSGLFVPADSERKLAKGIDSGADALLIDLEDSVSFDKKAAARKVAAGFLKEQSQQSNRPLLYVRINAFDTNMVEEDLDAIMPLAPDGLVLPKSDHGKDVTRLDAMLRVYEAENGLDDGITKVMAIITETAIGTLNAGSYRRCSPRLMGLAWGAEDLSADVGAFHRRNADGTYRDLFRFARIQTLLGAVAAGVAPLDTVYPDFRDDEGFQLECREGMIDGFTGKMAIHPAQVSIINEVFTPSSEEIAKAKAIVEAFQAAGNPGVLAVNGEMLDRPHLLKAQKLLARARR